MTTLPFDFDKREELVMHLSKKLPAYQVKKRFGNIQVRTGPVTLTGSVNVRAEKKAEKLRITTNYDMRIAYWLMSWPAAIYIVSKKEKQLTMEREVAVVIEEFIENQNTNN